MDNIIYVSVDELYLDPNNPRLAEDFVQGEIADTLEKIRRPQDAILKKFIAPNVNEDDAFFDIETLKASFERIGFIDIDRIICRQVEDGKYLVLEGNRRTSAIKALAKNNFDDIKDEKIQASLRSIPITVIEGPNAKKGRSEKTIREEIKVLLGVRHHGSLLPWDALPQAYNVYDTYVGLNPKQPKFKGVRNRFKDVGAMLSISQQKVKQRIKTYLVYRQLKDSIDAVKPHHFSLIQAILESRPVLKEFIDIDEDSFIITEESIGNFDLICEFEVRDSKRKKPNKLREPKSVNKLAKLVKAASVPHPYIKDYATNLLGRFLDGEIPLESYKDKENDGQFVLGAIDDLTRTEKQFGWVEEIEKLTKKMLDELKIEDFGKKPNDQLHKDKLARPLMIIDTVLGVS